MTEKEQLSTTQPDHIRDPWYPPEDEISLMDLLEVIARKKILILLTVSIFTLLSIFYTQLVAPVYKVTVGFLPPETNLATHFPDYIKLPECNDVTNCQGKDSVLNKSLFRKFLTAIRSYRLQEKIFVEGNFLKKFADNSSGINMRKEILSEINKSIQIRISTGRHREAKKEIDATTYLEITGTKPEVISDFLGALTESAANEVMNNVKRTMQQVIKADLYKYSAKLKNLRLQDKSSRAAKISRYSGNLKIAKKLGILENNFSSSVAISPLSFLLNEREATPPIWYLYGQRALEQEIDRLKSQPFTDQNIEGAAELNSKIEELSRVDLSKINFLVAAISQTINFSSQPVKHDKRKIVAIGMVLGLFVGIILAFLANSMAHNRKRKNSLLPQQEPSTR